MSEEIINRVSKSKLVAFDLEDYYPKGERFFLDIKNWLYEGIILKEKEFRVFIAEHDWEHYQDSYVALGCTTDAVVPGWAYMLIVTRLHPYVKKAIVGSLEDMENYIYQTIIENLDVSDYKDKPIIIKGCSNKAVPANAYLLITAKMQSVARSIMYGEACSCVPLFKRK